MQKKIFVGKAGQKIIFDRDSEEAKRNNMNGNLDVYKFFDLVFKSFNDVEFYMLGECDKGIEKYKNVKCIENIEELSGNEFSAGLIFAGVFNEEDKLFKYLMNKNNNKWYMFTTDPRCLMESVRLNKLPEKIYALSEGYKVFLKNKVEEKEYFTKYLPLEKLLINKNNENIKNEKDIYMVISTSYSDMYNRESYIIEYVKLFSKFYDRDKIQVYGRISNECKERLGEQYKGLLKYEDFMNVFKKAMFTLCIPSEKGWVTSKYIESLNNDVVPYFHKDYAIELIKREDVEEISYDEDYEKSLEKIKRQLMYDRNYNGEDITKEIEKIIE